MGTSTTSPLLDALRAGATVEWVPLRLEDGSTIEVMSEPLRAADGVAYSCTPVEAQQCADLLDAVLLTPKIADLMWLVADVRLTPHTQPTGHSSHVCPGCGQHDPGPWELCWRCGSTERRIYRTTVWLLRRCRRGRWRTLAWDPGLAIGYGHGARHPAMFQRSRATRSDAA